MRPCPACDNGTARGPIEAREMMLGLRDEFTYYQCEECSTLFLDDPQQDMDRYYPRDYYSMRPPDTSPRSRLPFRLITQVMLTLPAPALEWLASRIDLKPQFVRYLAGLDIGFDDPIADIGSGEGRLLRRMASCGFTDLSGFDPFVRHDRDEGPIRIRRSDIHEIEDSFRLVMFNHSLEHVPDPLAALKAARSLVTPDGAILVRLPVVNRAWDLYGTDWVALDPPRHITVPSPRGMELLAERAGLKVERVFYDSTSFQFWASERYVRDIPLQCDEDQLPVEVRDSEAANERKWTAESRELNRQRRGDTAGFILRSR